MQKKRRFVSYQLTIDYTTLCYYEQKDPNPTLVIKIITDVFFPFFSFQSSKIYNKKCVKAF